MLSTTVGFSWNAKRIPSTNLIFPFNPTPPSQGVSWCQGVPPIWPVRRSTCLALLVGSANKGHSAGHLASKLKDASGHTIQNLLFWVECEMVLNETQTKSVVHESSRQREMNRCNVCEWDLLQIDCKQTNRNTTLVGAFNPCQKY